MEIILSFLAGLIVAAVVAYFQTKLKVQAATSRLQAEFDSYKQNTEANNAERDRRDAEAKQERLRQEQEAKAEREELNRRQLELLSAKFEASSQQLLKQRQEELGQANSESIGRLIDPLQKEMENVRKLMSDTRSANEKSNSSLEGALRQMVQQTENVGRQADNLAEALKNKGKVHGDWGEQVLEDILRGSGLREGEEFTCQESFKTKKGELRPDVVINCADGKRIIVDSKVSLTAYADALGAATEEERLDAIKRNCESVKKHVKELAEKDYPKYVDGSMRYVLMFVPNEGAYVMAMNHDRSLAQDTFRKGVIIVNPTNLMLTLNLVLQTWQQTRQENNCREILEKANKMYEKIIGIVDACTLLGNQLTTVRGTYSTLSKRISEGDGNLLGQAEELRVLGVTSTKQRKVRKAVKADDADEAMPLSLDEA